MKRSVNEQKKIVGFAKANGIEEAASYYAVSPASIYRWQKLYPQQKTNSPLSLSSGSSLIREIKIRINFLAEFSDTHGNSHQIYQLTATDKHSKQQYIALSLERNKTVVDIYKEYLQYSLQKAGLPQPVIHCFYYRQELQGYQTWDRQPVKKREKDRLLNSFIDQNPDLTDFSQLLPVALAGIILKNSEHFLQSVSCYPIFIRCAYLKTLAKFSDLNQAWNQLVNDKYRQQLLKSTMEYLENEARQAYFTGNSSYSLAIYEKILNFNGCIESLPQVAARIYLAKAKIHSQKHEHTQAIKDLHSALKHIPDQAAEAYFRLSSIYQALRNLPLAEEKLHKAIAGFKVS